MTAVRLADTLRACIDALTRTPRVRGLEMQIAREQVHFMQRLKDKDAVIAELRTRLAIAEMDALRREQIVRPPAKPVVVPEFRGPLGFQDEMAKMMDEPAEPVEAADGTHSE